MPAKKKGTPRPQAASAPTKRVRKTASYKSFRLSKPIRHPKGKLPSAPRLLLQSFQMLKKHPKVIFGMLLIYALLLMAFVRGFGTSLDIPGLKEYIGELFDGNSGGQLATGATLFGLLLTSSGAPTEVAGVYQTTLLLITSLALIWSLRQLQAGAKIRVRDGFYNGMYPLIPFILVLVVIGLQMLPLIVANLLYNIVATGTFAVTIIEKTLFGILIGLFALLTAYMFSSSIFALYIVTLPDMTPMKALRSARQLVLNRRWSIVRKLLFIPFAFILLGALVVIPSIIFLPGFAELIFFVLTVIALALLHGYLYNLYRSLL
jgi:hypothetical protein